jgi:predicted nucleotidyltransferase component of viral defense system
MLDTNSLNPHRVQVYSIEEIWKAILARLVQLSVLRDPNEKFITEDSESTELDGEFDFVEKASKRVDKFLMKTRSRKDKGKSVGDQMRQNDLIVM